MLRKLKACARLMALCLAALLWFAPAHAKSYDLRPFYIDLNLTGGLEEEAIGGLATSDARSRVGLEATYEPNYFPVQFYLSFYQSEGKDRVGSSSMSGDHWGLGLGVKKSFVIERYPEIQPYLDCGVVFAGYGGDLKIMEDSSGIAAGPWAGGGVLLTLFEKLNLGVDARYSYVPVDVDGDLVNGEGFSASLLLGYRWSMDI